MKPHLSIIRLLVVQSLRKTLVPLHKRLGFNLDKHYVLHLPQKDLVYPFTHNRLTYYGQITGRLLTPHDIEGAAQNQYLIPLAHRINWNHYLVEISSQAEDYLQQHQDQIANLVAELETRDTREILDFELYERSKDYERLCNTLTLASDN